MATPAKKGAARGVRAARRGQARPEARDAGGAQPVSPEEATRAMARLAGMVNAWLDDFIPRVEPGPFYEGLRGWLDVSKSRVRPSLAVYEPIRHVVDAGGKRVRPALTLLAAQAVGGDPRKVLPTAGAVELLHTFTLVHDDIMDEDLLRRGQPTVHAIWGVPIGITVGDGLYALAFRALAENASVPGVDARLVNRVVGMAATTSLQLCQGQTMDLLFEDEETVGVDEYLEMIRLKTGVLLEFALRAGALLAGGSEEQVEAIGSFGSPLGVAFQVKDDVLDLTATEAILGKPVGSDIRKGKKTLMVVHFLSTAPEAKRRRLREILGRGAQATDAEVAEAVRLLTEGGSIEYARRKAAALVEEAKGHLGRLPPGSGREALASLAALADYVIHREL